MLVAVIGFMGVGKTQTASALSGLLALSCFDMDEIIGQRERMSIAELFSQGLEERFRDAESELLRELSNNESGIISCGGGIVLREENRELLKRSFTTIWLKASSERVFESISRDTSRPLAYGKSRRQLSQLLAQREPLYHECAHFTLDCGELSAQAAARELLALLNAQQQCGVILPVKE